MWIITFFGLKSAQDLENRAAHPDQELPGVPPPSGYQPVYRRPSSLRKNRERTTAIQRRVFSRFFLRKGDVCTQAIQMQTVLP